MYMCRLKGDYVDALVAYANVLVDQGITDDAIIVMEQAMTSAADNNADMFNNYGAFYSKLGNCGNIPSNQAVIVLYRSSGQSS